MQNHDYPQIIGYSQIIPLSNRAKNLRDVSKTIKKALQIRRTYENLDLGELEMILLGMLRKRYLLKRKRNVKRRLRGILLYYTN